MTNSVLLDVKFLKNSLVAYATGYNGTILKTTDAGETWVQQISPETINYNSICIISDTRIIIAGEESTIISTDDGGTNWVIQNRTQSVGYSSIHKLEFSNSQIGIAIGDDTQGYRTTNGGLDWEHFDFGEFTDFTDLYITSDRSEGYIAGDSRLLYKTTDAGETWTDQNPSGIGANFTYAIAFNSAGYGVLSGRISFGAKGVLYNTNDDGVTWTEVYRDSLNLINDLVNINFSTFIAVCDSGIILRSDDIGETWTRINSGATYSLTKIQFISSKGWALGGNELLKTTDGGLSWNIQVLNLPPSFYPRDLFFVSESVGYIAGRNFSNDNSLILKTTDSGLTWEEQFIPTGIDEITCLYFLGENIGWAGGESSSIFKTTTGGLTEVGEITFLNDNLPQEFVLYQNYPNPFNPSTKIRYSIPIHSNIRITLFDILGREVKILINEEHSAGNYEFEFDASNLASGIYFYSIQASSFNQVKKMILLR